MKFAALSFLVGCTCIKGQCVTDKCRDIGNDCCAPRDEEAICSDGWVPQRFGECAGDWVGKYHCCPPGTEPDPVCAEDKCTSIGWDCCAPGGEEATCSDGWVPKRYGECSGDQNGKYYCCSPGTDPVCRKDLCSSSGDDCNLHGQEEATCANDSWVPKKYAQGSKYICCPQGVEPDPICVEDRCTSNGNDCCAPGAEKATCSEGWVPKRFAECAGDQKGKYHCCSPGTEPDPICVEYKCTSSGNDCLAPGGEEATCRDSWVPKRTGEQDGKYHCCPPGTEPDPICVEDKCTSSGNDCCAPGDEKATCSEGWVPKRFGDCSGDPKGKYHCCSPGTEMDPVCREDMCTSNGNDCWLGGQEEATCSNSSWVPKKYERGTKYICCPPGTEPDPICVEYRCTSNGNDCCAPGDEKATCSDSWVPKRIGECFGDQKGKYHCCPPGTEPDPVEICVEDKCTSSGNDCCAPGDEKATCSEGWVPKRFGECAGDPKGKYHCCSPGSEKDPVCRQDMCTSTGNDCHVGGQEEATCSNSSWVPKMYDRGTKYICCPPGTEPDNCVHNKCTSDGNDCCAPKLGDWVKEEATCSSGLKPVRYGECFGDPMGQYHCCSKVVASASVSTAAHSALVTALAVAVARV